MKHLAPAICVVLALAARSAAAADTAKTVTLDQANNPQQALPVRSAFVLTKELSPDIRRAVPIFVRYAYRLWSLNPPKPRRTYSTSAPLRPNDCGEVARALASERFLPTSLAGVPTGRLDVTALWSEPPYPGAKGTTLGQAQLVEHKMYNYLDGAHSVYVPAVWTRKNAADTFQVHIEDKTFFRHGAQYCMFFMVEKDRIEDRKASLVDALRAEIVRFGFPQNGVRAPIDEDALNTLMYTALYAIMKDVETTALREAACAKLTDPHCKDPTVPPTDPILVQRLVDAIWAANPHRKDKLEALKTLLRTTLVQHVVSMTDNIVTLRRELGEAFKPGKPLDLARTPVAGLACHAPPPSDAKTPVSQAAARELLCLLFARGKIQVQFVPPPKVTGNNSGGKTSENAPAAHSEDYLWNNHKIVHLELHGGLISIDNGAAVSPLKTADLLLEDDKMTLKDLLELRTSLRLEAETLTPDLALLGDYLEKSRVEKAVTTDTARLKALSAAIARAEAACKRYPALGADTCATWSADAGGQPRAAVIRTAADQLGAGLALWDEAVKKVDLAFTETSLDLGAGATPLGPALELTQNSYVSSFVTPTIGVAILPLADQAFAMPYAAAQIFFWPNHVDEPMWSNGRIDLRRLVAVEVGLGITSRTFGPDDRYHQLTTYNTPPFLYGLAFQLIPYTTVSVGGALMKVRRSSFAREELALFNTFYVGISVELNFFNLARSRFSAAEYGSAKSVLRPTP